MNDFKEKINILAIETSCDETSVAVVKNGKEVLSNHLKKLRLHFLK